MVNVGIDIKDIPKIDDKEFSITLNAFFVVRWTDKRMIIDQHKMKHIFKKGKLKKKFHVLDYQICNTRGI